MQTPTPGGVCARPGKYINGYIKRVPPRAVERELTTQGSPIYPYLDCCIYPLTRSTFPVAGAQERISNQPLISVLHIFPLSSHFPANIQPLDFHSASSVRNYPPRPGHINQCHPPGTTTTHTTLFPTGSLFDTLSRV